MIYDFHFSFIFMTFEKFYFFLGGFVHELKKIPYFLVLAIVCVEIGFELSRGERKCDCEIVCLFLFPYKRDIHTKCVCVCG